MEAIHPRTQDEIQLTNGFSSSELEVSDRFLAPFDPLAFLLLGLPFDTLTWGA